MTTVAVIIPYFQTERGILRRALQSVLAQTLAPDTRVNILLVDDGSPAPVQDEMAGLVFAPPFRLTLIRQDNRGVAAARNTGLAHAEAATDLVAFLDSDDSWRPGHLARAVRALAEDGDLYFTDNARPGHHDSYFAKCCPKLLRFAQPEYRGRGYAPVPAGELIGLILQHFPVQSSTVVYRRGAFAAHRFPDFQKFAGEDHIFFTRLAAEAKSIYFSSEVMVVCGQGINMYFDNLRWDSPKLLPIIADQIHAAHYMRRTIAFGRREARLARRLLAGYRKNFVFHATRLFIKQGGAIPAAVKRLAKDDRNFILWFAGYFWMVLLGRTLGTYKPN